jgi:pyruvate,water dikinase
MPLREAPKHYALVVFWRARQAAQELGRRFAAAGWIATDSDVFFLEWREVQSLACGDPPPADLEGRIAARKAELERYRSEQPPDFVRSDGVPVGEGTEGEEGEGEDGEGDVLRGTAVSGGGAAGRVRILHQPDARQMRNGEVLVVRYADPGWTPLFAHAAAVVMEVGGLMCHAAVVAREMGIPAVFGARDATRLLSDGQMVRVDGGAGTVELLERAGPDKG